MPENNQPDEPEATPELPELAMSTSASEDGTEEAEVSFTVAGTAGPNPTFVEGPIQRVGNREMWTMTIAFFAHDAVHAMTMARHAARRVAKVFPRFNKDLIQIMRENHFEEAFPLYCDFDIYCILAPHHEGPCRCQDGRNLDEYDADTDPTPDFGADL